jgi:hypothetical protein
MLGSSSGEHTASAYGDQGLYKDVGDCAHQDYAMMQEIIKPDLKRVDRQI